MFRKKKQIKILLERVSSKDDQVAFREFFNIYFDKVFRSAFAIVKDIELSEEIAEDVFYNFWQMRRRYEEIKNVEGYLYISAKNLALLHIKKGKKIIQVSRDEFDMIPPIENNTPEEIILTKELEQFLDRAVEQLPERCREIFKLVRLKGMKYKEVAGILDISVKTVENQIAIAIKKLKVELDEYLNECDDEAVIRKISSGL